MKELTSSELKDIQLQIMDYVDLFCKINGINYSLACGSLLGAIRHGGFIPWDDDIDICLLRSEYNRFTKLWNEQKENHPYELINIESGNNIGYAFGKIHDPNTITYIGSFERTGVFIDVFPIDYVIDEDDYVARLSKISLLYKKRNDYLQWKQVMLDGAPLYKRLYAYLKKPKISFEQIAVEISETAQEVKIPTGFVYEMVDALTRKHPIPVEVYREFIDCRFENRNYRVIKDYEQYLSIVYGDWRTLPSVEQRITHHSFKAYWKYKE